MKRWNALFPLAILVLAISARGANPFEAVEKKCQLGDSITNCRSQIRLRELSANEVIALLDKHPFSETHCFLKSHLKKGRLIVWTDDKEDVYGWPLYVFGSFSSDGKMTDLLGTHLGYTHPLVPGTYSKRIEGLKKGMSVTKMYELIGKTDAEYVRNKAGKWIVRFSYKSFPGQFYVVEADAATGVIISVENVTI